MQTESHCQAQSCTKLSMYIINYRVLTQFGTQNSDPVFKPLVVRSSQYSIREFSSITGFQYFIVHIIGYSNTYANTSFIGYSNNYLIGSTNWGFIEYINMYFIGYSHMCFIEWTNMYPITCLTHVTRTPMSSSRTSST